MTDTCGTISCQMNQEGDNTIPENLKENWNEFIEKNCSSFDCPKRNTAKCCVWGKFMAEQ